MALCGFVAYIESGDLALYEISRQLQRSDEPRQVKRLEHV